MSAAIYEALGIKGKPPEWARESVERNLRLFRDTLKMDKEAVTPADLKLDLLTMAAAAKKFANVNRRSFALATHRAKQFLNVDLDADRMRKIAAELESFANGIQMPAGKRRAEPVAIYAVLSANNIVADSIAAARKNKAPSTARERVSMFGTQDKFTRLCEAVLSELSGKSAKIGSLNGQIENFLNDALVLDFKKKIVLGPKRTKRPHKRAPKK